jgi:hypothetical protein
MKTQIPRMLSRVMTMTAAIFLVASTAAAAIITPTTATSPNGVVSTRSPAHTRDSSGLSPDSPWDRHTSGGNTIDGTLADATMWLSTSTTPEITWNLGDLYDLTGFHLWNYNEAYNGQTANTRGIETANISISTDGTIFTTIVTGMNFANASGFDTYTGEDKTLIATAQYVRFNITDNYGDLSNTGLSEIRFIGTIPVPEPTTLSSLLVASLCLALGARHRLRRSH